MPDIISAKCFGCGHVVKVPSALGGKKARCPQCTNTIVIPTSSESHVDIVPDDQLPEVARDEDVVQDGEVIEEDASALEAEAAEEAPSRGTDVRRRTRTRQRRGTSVRKKGETRKSGPRHTRVTARRKSSTGLVVGIIIAVVAAVGIAVGVAVGTGGGGNGTGGNTAEEQPPATQTNPEDHDLEVRCLDYTAAVNRQDPSEIQRFYKYDKDTEQQVLRSVNRLVGQGTRYEDVKVTSSSASSGQTTFTHSGGTTTLQWEKVGGKWLISGAP